jgi:hypothetical protein
VIPNSQFVNQPKAFWAYIRTISEKYGYTLRGKDVIKVPDVATVIKTLLKLQLDPTPLFGKHQPTPLGNAILQYFQYRADVLNSTVKSLLMDVETAKNNFERLKKKLHPTCPLPMNKQKREKKAPAYFTGIINMLIQANLDGLSCNYSPRALTTVTKDRLAIRTLARWVDGAFPDSINPIAVWEIKEYYYTTTFGSRVADGVYESLMDGMELEEMYEKEKIKVLHYLMVDDYNTWWNDGKSYLCRIIDMLHMRYVDEVLFGREVFKRLPSIVKEWVSIAHGKGNASVP